jgi:hypothetical protein
MAVNKHLWISAIVANLYAKNPHLNFCIRRDDAVLNGAVVHIPQAGARPTVTKNRATFPAAVGQRVDGDIVYPLETYSTNPTHILKAETYELSYDKMISVLNEHGMSLDEVVGADAIYQWLRVFPYAGSTTAAAAPIIPTSGGNLSAHMPGATGNRKLFKPDDLKKARTALSKANIPANDRYAIISPDMMDQLMSDPDLKKRDVALEVDYKNGVIARLYGFDIIERSFVAAYDNATLIDPVSQTDTDGEAIFGYNEGDDDCDAVVCYQKDAVEFALGTVNLFTDLDNPAYYGDIYSTLIKGGGRKTRANAAGIVSIVQAIV